jgi:glutamyl-tRNA synthetase
MDYHKLAELLFPHIDKTPEDYRNEMYPQRQLPQGAVVDRFAPSPTGFLHIGGLYTALVNERMAHQTGGRIILRIEDTDKKREVEDGVSGIVEGLKSFGLEFDEGMMNQTEQKGDYGPYQQSRRAEIYQCFCKSLVEQGLAYPCFCSEEDLAEIRRRQESEKALPGYHSSYAKCRDLTYEQIAQNIQQGLPYVVRLRSPGKIGGRIKYKDVIRGEIEMDENVIDVVLLKTDGIPTYHFAHAVDDSLMGTTHVIRSDEWVSSVPLHLQLFYVLGLKPPKYAHISPL